ncbi:uncharacterized protein CELE_Y54E2A.5 [Caenorhabditis elegans]|uniref:Secreted protein n=1 Tax=Caenorhabditis elegans TaxID=6239 RepID=Q9XWI9_CAEEL|nr:Secreted protein [Caenorhabditis elegans]CAA21678.1 Secreted protein [Caenorhabditis elegans]|eukprot:NP_497061.1 Uncharacterized protein CELE_Y54E2A.5 [Caenorhabditis elegans]
MKLVLAVIFVFLTFSAADVDGDVQCGNNKFCRVGFRPFKYSQKVRNDFQLLRVKAQELEILSTNRILGIRSDADLSTLISWQSELCRDDTVGFVLDKNVSEYRVSCVWTGSSQLGQCRAVPPKYMAEVYSFIEEDEWEEKLQKVRNAIGCDTSAAVNFQEFVEIKPPKTNGAHGASIRKSGGKTNTTAIRYVKRHRTLSEFVICNDRCVQGGIGYSASLVIILALAISFFKNCIQVE